jgi:membrane associated rhomboid family serine protease
MNRPGQPQFQFSISPMVKKLLIANVVIWFVFQIILEKLGLPFTQYFSLVPSEVIFSFQFWQPVTYMFLHSGSVTHILFNMLMLWMMGSELEQRWGKNFFLFFYIGSGVGAAVIYILGMVGFYYVKPEMTGLLVPVVGASGALFGLMLAYGVLFGERMIYFFGVFPIKAKFFVLIMGAIQVASMFTVDVAGGDVAYLCHLGGLISGYLLLLGAARFQRFQWNQKAKKRNSKLKLVVDNEKTPKYWN